MAYVYDVQARREAADHPVSEAGVEQLREQCARVTAKLGEGGVRGHRVSFSPGVWAKTPGLPSRTLRAGSISRGEVLDIGRRVRSGRLPATDVLMLCFVWGWGPVGYGQRRYHDIRAAAGNQLEPSLQRVLAMVSDERSSTDLIAGYAQLYGGYDYRNRAAPGQEPWSRLRGFGPAFFTKFLYFSVPGALILDQRLARAVYDLGGLPHLVSARRRSLAWTPYRYAVYLHWMRQTAASVGVDAATLELTCFQPPEDLDVAQGAAHGRCPARVVQDDGDDGSVA